MQYTASMTSRKRKDKLGIPPKKNMKVNIPGNTPHKKNESTTKWGPQTIAKSVYNSNVTMVYCTYSYTYWGL